MAEKKSGGSQRDENILIRHIGVRPAPKPDVQVPVRPAPKPPKTPPPPTKKKG